MMSPQERWDRIAQGMLWIGGFFLVLTGYNIFQGEEAGGLLMTAVAGVVLLGLWRVACWRRDA
jgi:ABC-type uncharacterized transport system permease subunit